MKKEQIIKRILDKSKKEQLEIFFELYDLILLKKINENITKYDYKERELIKSLKYYYNVYFKSDDK